jgi:uncharacterized protein YecE (DUF72 family)
MTAGDTRIGISGWRYGPWRGVFYPRDLPQRQELAFASRALPTIDINGTFHSFQRPACLAQWRDDMPEGCVFAIKGPRYIMHIRRLKETHLPPANFFASGVLARLDKYALGIINRAPRNSIGPPVVFASYLQ